MKSIQHFCDNNEAERNNNDKGFKVRKLIAAAQKSFVKFGVFEQHLAVDEMIVKYYGHNILKQFVGVSQLGLVINFGHYVVCLVTDTILICIVARAHLKANTQTYCLDQKLY